MLFLFHLIIFEFLFKNMQFIIAKNIEYKSIK